MKIIDNRYKIESILVGKINYESYLISDLWEDNKSQYMKLYNYDNHKELINYFIDSFIHLSSINHEYLLSSEKFGLVKSIDTKKTNMLLYYYIAEYVEGCSLDKVKDSLNLEEKLRIILDTILTIDYLHFRGISYKLLSPAEILVLQDKSIKITDIVTIIEKIYNSNYNDFTRHFISPEALINRDESNRSNDYYSLGVFIKYLLLEDFLVFDADKFSYQDEEKLTKEQKDTLNIIINKLTSNRISYDKRILIDIVDEIIDIFRLDYVYDLVKSRDNLYFHNGIIGRDKEITQVMEIDENIVNGRNTNKGLVIKADFGIGKTRFLNEISHKLKMKGRDVYYIEVHESEGNDLLDMSNILKQSIKDTPSDLLNKYRDELSRILPELRLYVNDNNMAVLDQKSERFRLYNRITHYFNELSKENIIYIIIDDLQKCNLNFLTLLDYLVMNITSNNLFFIFSFESNHGGDVNLIIEKLKEWENGSLITNIHIHKFDLEEIGKQVQNILGISNVPYNISSVLFKESNGNPRYIEYIIKHLYSIGEIFMNVSGEWYIKPSSYSELYFPSDIEDAFKKQINIIKEKYLDLFRVMSVFEDALYKKTLFMMLDVDNEKIEKDLNELRNLSLIDEKLADFGYSYNINSSELKKLIYHEIPEVEKIELHRKAAHTIKELEPDNIDITLEELIYHLFKSNQINRAINIILEKVEGLDNRYSTHARLLLEKGHNKIKDTNNPLKLEILEKLVDIYSAREVSEKGNAYLDEYKKQAELLNDYKHIIKSKNAMIDIYYRKGYDELVFKEIEEIEHISEKNNFIEGKIIALALRAKCGLRTGELDEAEKFLFDAISLSEKYMINTSMGTIFNRLGLINYLRGNMEEATQYYEKSIAYYEEIGEFLEVTRPINNISNIYVDYYADADKAMQNYMKGLEITNKYGFREVEIVFLINIATIYSDRNEFGKALEFLEEAKEGALEFQDINNIFFVYISLADIYLFISEYDRAFEYYGYLKEMYETKQIVDIEIVASYNSFLGAFYEYMGQWEKSIEHAKLSTELCKDYNQSQYLDNQSRIIRCKFFGQAYFNKVEFQEIVEVYRKTKYKQERRRTLLEFAIMCSLYGDNDYAKELLEEDSKLIGLYDIDYLNKLRIFSISLIGENDKSIEKLIKIAEQDINNNYYNIGLYLNIIIGFKLHSKGKCKLSLKYLLEALDIIYRSITKIPDNEMKLGFIKSHMGDRIKDKIIEVFREVYNYELTYKELDKNLDNLYDYFDITPLIDIIGSEEFVKITQLNYYGDALNIYDIENLVSKLNEDFQYNLDLILSYLGKETFAKKGYILRYIEGQNKPVVASYLGNDPNFKINNNILNAAKRSKNGFYINSSTCDTDNYRHKKFLSDDIKGIICIPIISSNELSNDMDRRKQLFEEPENYGYLYLETDRVFNRFDLKRFELVHNLLYLIYVNLENNNLKLIATTDKLTGTLTRKYFEIKFDQVISSAKSSNGYFSVLMLDIDKFKKINDSYGHRKGDEVLSAIGNILKSTVRFTDIVARYGGEEFVVILKNTTDEDSMTISEKIRANIEKIKIHGIDNPITVSIGISLFPQHSQFKEDLIEKADQALYYAKETGRNRVVLWNTQMDNTSNRVDKLAGILTGNTDEDNRNILALIDVIELIKEKLNLEYKIYKFLGIVLETIDAEYVTMVSILDIKKTKIYLTRARFNDEWVETPMLSEMVIDRVIKTSKGEFLIDWDNIENLDNLSGLPNWQSIIVLPLIKDEEIKGVLYISTSIKNKEFNFNDYNLSKNFASIFASVL